MAVTACGRCGSGGCGTGYGGGGEGGATLQCSQQTRKRSNICKVGCSKTEGCRCDDCLLGRSFLSSGALPWKVLVAVDRDKNKTDQPAHEAFREEVST